jgi:hypothetical protein
LFVSASSGFLPVSNCSEFATPVAAESLITAGRCRRIALSGPRPEFFPSPELVSQASNASCTLSRPLRSTLCALHDALREGLVRRAAYEGYELLRWREKETGPGTGGETIELFGTIMKTKLRITARTLRDFRKLALLMAALATGGWLITTPSAQAHGGGGGGGHGGGGMGGMGSMGGMGAMGGGHMGGGGGFTGGHFGGGFGVGGHAAGGYGGGLSHGGGVGYGSHYGGYIGSGASHYGGGYYGAHYGSAYGGHYYGSYGYGHGWTAPHGHYSPYVYPHYGYGSHWGYRAGYYPYYYAYPYYSAGYYSYPYSYSDYPYSSGYYSSYPGYGYVTASSPNAYNGQAVAYPTAPAGAVSAPLDTGGQVAPAPPELPTREPPEVVPEGSAGAPAQSSPTGSPSGLHQHDAPKGGQ